MDSGNHHLRGTLLTRDPAPFLVPLRLLAGGRRHVLADRADDGYPHIERLAVERHLWVAPEVLQARHVSLRIGGAERIVSLAPVIRVGIEPLPGDDEE